MSAQKDRIAELERALSDLIYCVERSGVKLGETAEDAVKHAREVL